MIGGSKMRLVGGLVELARAGGPLPDRHDNPYLAQAAACGDVLLTSAELKNHLERGALSLFDQGTTKVSGVVVEVGSYFGKTLVEMAQERADLGFVGLDITYKRTVKAAKKIRALQLEHAKVGICDARQFVQWAAPSSLLGVCIFFPDPWPKLRHAKNRLLQRAFFADLAKALHPQGFVWIKTDALDYFTEAMAEAEPFFESHEGAVPSELGGRNYVTTFEEMFLRQGLPTASTVLRTRHQ